MHKEWSNVCLDASSILIAKLPTHMSQQRRSPLLLCVDGVQNLRALVQCAQHVSAAIAVGMTAAEHLELLKLFEHGGHHRESWSVC